MIEWSLSNMHPTSVFDSQGPKAPRATTNNTFNLFLKSLLIFALHTNHLRVISSDKKIELQKNEKKKKKT